MTWQGIKDDIEFFLVILASISASATWLYTRWKKKRIEVSATLKENPTMTELKRRSLVAQQEVWPDSKDDSLSDSEADAPCVYLYVNVKNTGTINRQVGGAFVTGLAETPLPLRASEPTNESLKPEEMREWSRELNSADAARVSSIYIEIDSRRHRISKRDLRAIQGST